MKSLISLEGISKLFLGRVKLLLSRVFLRFRLGGSFALPVLVPLLGCLFVASSAVAADAEPEVRVQLSQDRIYEGESVLYRVTVKNLRNPPQPKLDGFDDFRVQSRGAQSLDSEQITMDGRGNMTRVVQYGRAYDYLLTPKRTGELTIPAPTVDVEGKVLRGEALTVRVLAPEDQDMAILEVSVNKDSVYPMQPFTVTLNVAVKSIPGQYSGQDPMAMLERLSRPTGFSMSLFDRPRFSLPRLSIPWATDEQLPDVLEPERRWDRWLGTYLNRQGAGFRVNNVGRESQLSLFGDGPLVFAAKPERTRRDDKSGKTAAYWEYMFERTFWAEQTGEITFGPVTLKGPFVTGVDSQNRFKLDDVYTIAAPVTVKAREIPLDGRPASYNGAIGQFEFKSKLAPTKAKVGDPMTLTVTVRGQGTLDAVTAPRLEDTSEIADHFRIHEATEESDDEIRRFTYGLRPLDVEIESFPPIEMSYFDVEREEYVTLQTEEIPLQISTAEELPSGDIAMADASSSGGRDIEIQEGGLLANHSLASLRNDSVDPIRWFTGLGSLAGVYMIVLLVTQKVRRVMADPDLIRRRTAAARARRRLRDAMHGKGGAQAEAESLRAAIVGLIADASGIDEAGLATGEVRERLMEIGTDETLVGRLTEWCEACDAARYGASDDAVHGLEQDAQALLEDLIKTFKSKKLLR